MHGANPWSKQGRYHTCHPPPQTPARWQPQLTGEVDDIGHDAQVDGVRHHLHLRLRQLPRGGVAAAERQARAAGGGDRGRQAPWLARATKSAHPRSHIRCPGGRRAMPTTHYPLPRPATHSPRTALPFQPLTTHCRAQPLTSSSPDRVPDEGRGVTHPAAVQHARLHSTPSCALSSPDKVTNEGQGVVLRHVLAERHRQLHDSPVVCAAAAQGRTRAGQVGGLLLQSPSKAPPAPPPAAASSSGQ